MNDQLHLKSWGGDGWTYGETPCRAHLFFPESRCPEEHFEKDHLSELIFVGFHRPGFRSVPVLGLVTVARAEMDKTQTTCIQRQL